MRKSPVISFLTKSQLIFLLLFPAVIIVLFLTITGLLSSLGFFINSLLIAVGILTAHSFQITKRKTGINFGYGREQTFNKIKESSDHLTGAAGEIVFCIDLKDWRFTHINPAAEKMLGYPARICTGIPGFLFELLDPGSTQILKTAVNRFHHSSEKICTVELKWLNADRRSLILEVSLIPIRDSNGRPVSIEAIGRNVTRRKQEENRIHNYSDYDYDKLTSLYNRAYPRARAGKIAEGGSLR